MQTRLVHEDNGQRTFAVILETGDEVLTCLQRSMIRENVLAAQITAIGAFSDVVLMYFDWDKHTSAPAIASSGKWRTYERETLKQAARGARSDVRTAVAPWLRETGPIATSPKIL